VPISFSSGPMSEVSELIVIQCTPIISVTRALHAAGPQLRNNLPPDLRQPDLSYSQLGQSLKDVYNWSRDQNIRWNTRQIRKNYEQVSTRTTLHYHNCSEMAVNGKYITDRYNKQRKGSRENIMYNAHNFHMEKSKCRDNLLKLSTEGKC